MLYSKCICVCMYIHTHACICNVKVERVFERNKGTRDGGVEVGRQVNRILKKKRQTICLKCRIRSGKHGSDIRMLAEHAQRP